MSLTNHTKIQLSCASRSAIVTAMRSLPIQSQDAPGWLAPGQRYEASDISSVLRKDTDEGTIDSPALVQRIAASIPSHVLDGWSLFGRAVHCLIRGDTRAAVHLGYYAELRAVLAIVASEGIGIFNKEHFVVDEQGNAMRLCSDVGKPTASATHSMIWPVYSWWIAQPTAHDLLMRVIRPSSKAMRDWFNQPEDEQIYLAPSAQKWLADWGLDLRRMNTDQGARNASSYGPSALHGWETIEQTDALRTVIELWRTFEPADSSRFEEIDRLLLRRVLTVAFIGQTTRKAGSKNWHLDFGNFVDSFLGNRADYSFVPADREKWKEFLVTTGEKESATPLGHASNSSRVNAEFFPVELLSRAGLLLRLASGSCADHLAEVGVTWDSLMFWLNEIGIRRGIWNQTSYPESATDLWADIAEVLEDIDEGLTVGGDSRSKLEECERIGMWGFGV